MKKIFQFWCAWLLALGCSAAWAQPPGAVPSASAQQPPLSVLFIATGNVPAGKFRQLAAIAAPYGVAVQVRYLHRIAKNSDGGLWQGHDAVFFDSYLVDEVREHLAPALPHLTQPHMWLYGPQAQASGLPDAVVRQAAMIKLQMVGLKPEHASRNPADLSGGMIKRVALARALIMDPPLLLLDEPTAGLDPTSSDEFCALLRQLQADLGLTVVMVTHDLDTLFALSSRVAVLAEKRVLVSGTAQEVAQFDHPFTTTFFQGERGRRAMAPAPSATPLAAPASA